MTVRRQLLDMITGPHIWERPQGELDALRLVAAREVYAERREQIAVLRRRADDAGVTEIRALEDLVPLLFPHTVYKSYPASLVEKGRWDRMLRWLQTLSVSDVTSVDVADVRDVDDWIARLRAAGHIILATSGTSGKVSFLNQTVHDREMKKRHFLHTMGWPYATPARDRPFFAVGPSQGYGSVNENLQIQAEIWGRPGEVHFLTDEPMSIREISAVATLRKRMGEGTATPGEIAEAEAAGRAKGERMNADLQKMTEAILAHRHEPIFVVALWAQHLMIIERARALGAGDGEFYPGSIVSGGGGIKGVALPPNYEEQVLRFYGPVKSPGGYGMTELAQRLPRCEARRYHIPPALIVLLLDQPGERLINPPGNRGGVVEGRFAFLDLTFEGRWGGLISGDKVEIDFSDRCPCGRAGPTVLDSVVRYSQSPGQDDYIGCAGTIDSYIRGAMA